MIKESLEDILCKAFDLESNGDIASSINLFKRASRMGSNDARSKLGTIYDDVIRNPNRRQAIYWYRKGVEGGDSGCAWNLAMHYACLGRKRGYLHWLRVAEAMGDQDAASEIHSNKWWKKQNKPESELR